MAVAGAVLPRLDIASRPRFVRGAALVDQVKRIAGVVIGLRGGTLQAHVVRGPVVLQGDRALLSTTIIGLAWALFALGDQVQDARVQVRIAAAPESGPLCGRQRECCTHCEPA